MVVYIEMTCHNPEALDRKRVKEDVLLPCKARLHTATKEVTPWDSKIKLSCTPKKCVLFKNLEFQLNFLVFSTG